MLAVTGQNFFTKEPGELPDVGKSCSVDLSEHHYVDPFFSRSSRAKKLFPRLLQGKFYYYNYYNFSTGRLQQKYIAKVLKVTQVGCRVVVELKSEVST